MKKSLHLQLFGIGLLILLTGCAGQKLWVQSRYITIETLASYWVNTPDPRKENPNIGQCIFISWYIPASYLNFEDLHIEAFIRFRNGEMEHFDIPISKTKGFYEYCLLNEDYIQKKGFLSYKVNLMSGSNILEEWIHQMWVESIQFSDSN
jgi:hypothetical protein